MRVTNELDVDEREWLSDHLANTKGRDAMLYEAERIVPLLSDAEIEVVFGEDNLPTKAGWSEQKRLLEYLRDLPGAGYIRSSLLATLRVLDPNKIGDEYSVEMAQEVSGPQA